MVSDRDNLGGGMGGGPNTSNHFQDVDGLFAVAGNQVQVLARPPQPPAVPGPSLITILATDLTQSGVVNVRGATGVRMTAGPPPFPPVYSTSTNGIEILVGEAGNLTLQRGLLPVDQKIEMTPKGITLDAGMGKVTIQSLTEIELSAAGGMSKVKLGPEGVTIEGLFLKLDATIQAEIQSIVARLTAEAINQISGGITMIG